MEQRHEHRDAEPHDAVAKPGDSVSPSAPRLVQVWDLPTRAFHWALVVAVAMAAVTGYASPEWWMGVHMWAGYVIILLLVFRLVWAVFGSEYSRIASWVHPPRKLGEHVRGLLLLRPPHYLGHNPTGALMMIALMGVLTGLTVSGLLILGGEEKQGPLAESLLLRENLILAMITGMKRLPPGETARTPRQARPLAALASVGGFALVGAGVLAYLATLPPIGWRPLVVPTAFQQECGACHWAYHPSLLPRASWQGVMDGLDDHFGEDASLDETVRGDLTAFLTSNAAETWDTEAANRFRLVGRNEPGRITATPYWLQKHREIPEAVFHRAAGGKGACNTCHRDADTGRFDDQMITLPKE
jgi:cytochrome b